MDLSLFLAVISPISLFFLQVDLKPFRENTQKCVPNPPLHRDSVCLWAPTTLRVQTPAVVHAIPLYMTRFVHLFQIRRHFCYYFFDPVLNVAGFFFPVRVVQWKSCLFCTLEARTMLPERTCWTCWASPLSSMSLPTAPIILRTRTSTKASPWRTITKPTSAPGSTRRSSLSVSSLRCLTEVPCLPIVAVNSWVCWWRSKTSTQLPLPVSALLLISIFKSSLQNWPAGSVQAPPVLHNGSDIINTSPQA